MLYGNLIFIKKTGGDGSKYPVTERDIKIGRSENCLIRIYNPHVALEHCQLIIEDNGQATLRNLSNQSILNGKPLSSGDITLCHGDIFKLGERLARWEYLPTSKFYKQLLSPNGHLVAVVMPQQRSLGDQATSETSASEVSVLKSTPLGRRRFSERATSENSLSVKIRQSSGSELIHKDKGNLHKLLIGHHNLKSAKWVLKGGKVNERKSISGIIGSKTLRGKVGEKYRKSTLPSWKVNVVSPSGKKSSGSRDSLTKSNQKSAKSSKNTVQNLLKGMIKTKPEKLLLADSKIEIKEPQDVILESKSINDSGKSILKRSVTIGKESPLNFNERSTRSTHSPIQFLEKGTSKVLSTPTQKSSLKFGRLVHSESKVTTKKHSVIFNETRKMSLILNKRDFTPTQSLNKKVIKQEKTKTKIQMADVSDKIVLTPDRNNEAILKKKKETPRKSLKNTLIKSSSKRSEKISRKNLVNKTLKSPDVKTQRKSVIIKTPRSLTKEQSGTPKIRILGKVALDTVSPIPLMNLGDAACPNKSKIFLRKSVTTRSPIAKETPAKLIKSSEKINLPSHSQKIQNETVSSVPSLLAENCRNSLIMTSRTMSSLKANTVFSKGRKRKLSPTSSAERAAKKLKTCCPKKPDKNKKAALLVLGKANRKQQVSQNVKVLLRQKILKKAIKQSMAVSALDDKIGIKSAKKLEKGTGKKISRPKSKKFTKKNKSSENSSPVKYLKMPGETDVKSSTEENAQDRTPKNKKILATKVLQTSPHLSSDASVQSVSKQIKQSEFPVSDNYDSFMKKMNSPPSIFEKNAENHFFSSNRRCSKRLSYKNDTGRPDFIELSPTALGLIPKNVEIFKTPKDSRRRSSGLITPKNVQTTGIIKSASTSKIGNRKSVRFSSKDLSINSGFCSPSISEKIDFNFSPFDTPNITVDVFVSPLMDQSRVLKQNLSDSKVTPEIKEISSNSTKNHKNNSVSKTFIQKLQSPSSKKKLNKIFSNSSEHLQSYSASTSKSLSSIKVEKESKASDKNRSRKSDLNDLTGSRPLLSTPKNMKISKNSLSDLTGIRRLLRTSKDLTSPKNDLTDARKVEKLMRTPKLQKSPKNDLTDVRGVKKLMRTPKLQKSPKNDLTDMRGVKKLMRTPKLQKSPKNDLTDVRGVKKLMRTPKLQKSPKNDLTDVRGVKKLMRTPKLQKSPKNDLTDVRGVKKLMRTPKLQKSPKNDLTDMRGVKKLMRTPKLQKSPKNDLTDVRGVKKLMRTPKLQKSPKNDLTDVRGVKKLMRTPKLQKSPKNDLTDVRGVKKLMRTPKLQKSPKNDLTDVRGVKKLMRTPKLQKSPKNDLTDMRGVKKLMRTPKLQKSPKNDLTDVRGVKKLMRTPKLQKSPKNDLTDVEGIKKLLETSFSQKSPKNSLLQISEIEKSFESSVVQQLSKNLLKSTNVLSSQSEESVNTSLGNAEIKSETSGYAFRSKKPVIRNSHVKDFRAIRGRRSIYSRYKNPKNDLSDVIGVRELFSRHKPSSDYNISLTGVAELFKFSKTEVDFEQKINSRKKIPELIQKVSNTRTLNSKKVLKNEGGTKRSLRLRLRKAVKEEIEKKPAKSKKLKEENSLKKKTEKKMKGSQNKKALVAVNKSRKIARKETKTSEKKTLASAKVECLEENQSGLRSSRKRKILLEDVGISPPKLRKKKPGSEKSTSNETVETSKKAISRCRTGRATRKEISLKSSKKVPVGVKNSETAKSTSEVQLQALNKTDSKQKQKVQNKRSQIKSKKNVSINEKKMSPRKTRSNKATTATRKISETQSKSTERKVTRTAGKEKLSPVVKRSTRRK